MGVCEYDRCFKISGYNQVLQFEFATTPDANLLGIV